MAVALVGLATCSDALAQTRGSWNVDADGLWSGSSNWLNNTIAGGVSGTATFANNITATRTVTLDTSRSLGSFIFGDADTSSAASWIVAGVTGSTMTMNNGTNSATITVNALGTGASATISAVLAASGTTPSIIKDGVGTLVLAGTNNFTTRLAITSGTLQVSADRNLGAVGTFATDRITISNGATLRTSAAVTMDGARGITIGSGGGTINVNGGNLTIAAPLAGSGNTATVTGASAVILQNTSGTATDVNWDFAANNGIRAFFESANALGTGSVRVRSGIRLTSQSMTTGTLTNAVTLDSGAGLTARSTGGAQTYTNVIFPSTGTLVFNKDDQTTSNLTITSGGTLTGSLTIDTSPGGSNPVNSVFFDGVFSGTGGFVKSGTGATGRLVLRGANTYTGRTTINTGTLSMAQAGTLATTGTVNVAASGATFDIAGITASSLSIGALSGSTGSVVTLGRKTLSVGDVTSTTFAGEITGTAGTAGLTKTGAGTLTLSATNSYTGPTRISAGTLALGAAGSIASSSTISLAAGGVFDASAVTGGYTIPGSQVLAGAGAVAGGLAVGGSAAVIPAAGTGPLTVTGGLTLAAGGSYDWQMLDATGTAGTGWGLISTDAVSFSGLSSVSPFRVNIWSLSATGTNGEARNFDWSLAGSWRILTSASTITGFDPVNFALTTLPTGASPGFTNPTLGGTFSLALSGDGLGLDAVFTPSVPYTWYGNGSTAGGGGTWSSAGLTWNGGSGIVAWDPAKGALFGTVGGTVAVSGPQSVGSGLSFTADGYALTGDALSLTGDQAGNTVTVTGTSTATIATALTAANGMTKSGGGALVLAGDAAAAGGVKLWMGTLAVGAGGTTGSLTGDVEALAGTTLAFNRSDDSTYAGAISGAGGLRKSGVGTLTLTGANSHTGGTVLAGGTVVLGSADALGSSGTIAFVGGAIQYSTANTTDYSARISTSTGQSFVVDTNSQNVAFATGLAGAGNTLTKRGAGTLSLSGSGSFTGATRIADGTLELAHAGALAGSTLDMNAADAGTLALSLTGTTYAVGGLKGSRNINVGGNVLAAGGNGESTTYGGVISGAGGYTKTGTGTMVLSSTQAYAGTTGVNGGTLRLGLTNQLAATGTLSLGGSAAILDIGSTTQTLATMTTGNGALTNMAVTGSGGALVFTGPGNFEVGPGGTVTAGHRAVVSLAGITNLSYTSPDGIFRVGLKGGSSQSGATGTSSLTLATANTIVSGTLGLGDINGNNDGGGAQLFLGQTNVLSVGSVAMSASRADSLLQFAPGATSPTLVVRGTDGSGPMGTWLVGSVGQLNSASRKAFTATVDLSSGTTDAAVNWLVIGQANSISTGRGGSMLSRFTMGAGTLATGSITVGRILGSGTNGVAGAFSGLGTLSIANPAALVTATNVYLAENTFTGTGSATKTVSGTIALSAGMLRAGTIARGAQTGTNTVVVNTTFLWTGGTVGSLADADLTIDTIPLTLASGTGTFQADAGRTITVNAASPIAGGGGLVKTGAGTLVLAGSNSFTGATTISAGTLALAATASLGGSSTISVGSGAALDTSALASGLVLGGSQTLTGGGTVVGSAAIAAGSTLAPGAGLGTLDVSGGLTWNSGGNYNWQLLSGTGSAGSAWDVTSVTGTLAIAATSVDPFRLNLWTLSGIAPAVSGSAANFDSSQNYTWRIASAAGGITGFASDKFAVISGATNGTGGFANALGGGTFSIAQSGNDLNLVFTAGVPTVITIDVPSGTTQTQTAAGYPTLSGSIPVVKTGAGTLVLDQANTLSGSTTVQGGVLQLANGSALSASRLVVVAGGTGQVAPVTSTSVASLDLAGGNGLMDLTSGALTISSGMTATELVAEILEGRGDGSWNGTSGITSTTAAAESAAGTPRAVGWIDNGDGSLTTAYAAPGDTNIDWSIDILDAANFLSGGKFDTGSPAIWFEGDFSYDGIVDILDAADFFATGLYDAGTYNTAPGAAGSVAAVPEPSAIGLAAMSAVVLLAVSRRAGSRTRVSRVPLPPLFPALLLACSGIARGEEPGFTSLFDGTTLAGWKASENVDSWTVADGAIVCHGPRSHLFYVGSEPETPADFTNFHLKAEVMTRPNANAGIFFHTTFQQEGWPEVGYEMQVNNSFTKDPVRTGSIYNVVKVFSSPVSDDTWFTQELIVKGKRITVMVDGKTLFEFVEPEGVTGTRRLSHGTFALQAHDPGSEARFRNLRVKRLP
jgi:autotransporter-associated beta strand protein